MRRTENNGTQDHRVMRILASDVDMVAESSARVKVGGLLPTRDIKLD